MAIRDLLAKINADLDALEAAIVALDIEPELVALDTRIVTLTGMLTAKVDPQA